MEMPSCMVHINLLQYQTSIFNSETIDYFHYACICSALKVRQPVSNGSQITQAPTNLHSAGGTFLI
jgi:hypothetical protein